MASYTIQWRGGHVFVSQDYPYRGALDVRWGLETSRGFIGGPARTIKGAKAKIKRQLRADESTNSQEANLKGAQ